MTKKRYALRDATNANWPSALDWSGSFPTYEEAADRAREVTRHYNATYGCGGPDLRVVEVEEEDGEV